MGMSGKHTNSTFISNVAVAHQNRSEKKVVFWKEPDSSHGKICQPMQKFMSDDST